jgi:hypothetical protein
MDGGFAAILALRWGIALPSLTFRSMSMPSARQRNRLGRRAIALTTMGPPRSMPWTDEF